MARILKVGIDCEPFMPRPDVYMTHIWKNILKMSDELPVPNSKWFGAWDWHIDHPGTHIKNEILNYLTDLYDNRHVIRGAQLTELNIREATIYCRRKGQSDNVYVLVDDLTKEIAYTKVCTNDSYAEIDLTVNFGSVYNMITEKFDRIRFNGEIIWEWWMVTEDVDNSWRRVSQMIEGKLLIKQSQNHEKE